MKLTLLSKKNKSKELQKTCISIKCLFKGQKWNGFYNTKNWSIFKSFFFNLPQNLVSKLPSSPNVFAKTKVASYWNIKFKDINFEFFETSPEKILNIFKGLSPFKVAGIDNLTDKFLKDGTDILVRPISQLCNLSIKLNLFQKLWNWKTDPQNYYLTLLHPFYQELLKGLFLTKHQNFWVKTKFCTDFNPIFWKNYSTNTYLGHLTDKITNEFEQGLFTGMILINLQKAFNTTDYQILIKEMKHIYRFFKNHNCLGSILSWWTKI